MAGRWLRVDRLDRFGSVIVKHEPYPFDVRADGGEQIRPGIADSARKAR
jgi:hypothetical protein